MILQWHLILLAVEPCLSSEGKVLVFPTDLKFMLLIITTSNLTDKGKIVCFLSQK